ncbi:hypothetical protein CTEN210_10811 [Chaetoceros tenuissimus]|uniref:Uncharacterized protein n=1 Tax=Chaetoceros tenuissimus TaxID=426638 RepID=A0AAD3H8I3_9STRA|nr:hypothetical protein CTEN210_10811 [Chaetoceros tenuissimus]
MRILHHKFSSIALLTVFASQLHQALAFGSTAKYNKDSSGCRRDFLNSAIITTTGVIVGMPKNVYAKTMVDTNNDYPGTAVERLENVRARVATLSEEDLSGDWEDVRRKLLWAGGLKDLPDAIPGQGYTGHSFNDYNHVDLTTMTDGTSNNRNNGEVKEIAIGNFLGDGIRKASIPELGSGGSWSTCAIGCNLDPPQDVAHIQFKSKIAFKLVWVPNANFDKFVLVDDDGKELARGSPTGQLPNIRQRQMNYELVRGSKYARVVDQIAFGSS